MTPEKVKSRLVELRNVLGACLKTSRSEYLLAAREYLRELDGSRGLKILGCDGKCEKCFLGHEKFPEGRNPCKVWALHEALDGIEIKETKNPMIMGLSKELLEALEK